MTKNDIEDFKKLGGMFLRLAPIILFVGGVFLARPLLKPLGETGVRLFAAIFVIVVTGYCSWFARYTERISDEVENAGSRFANQVGQTIGATVFVVLLLLYPPFQDFMFGIVKSWAADPGPAKENDLILTSLILGWVGVGLLSAAASVVVSLVWTVRMSRR